MIELRNWVSIYRRLLPYAACVDIETCRWNGPISVVGVYKPKEGVIVVNQLVKGKTLDSQSLRDIFKGIKLIITFNGDSHDIPKIKSEFGDVFDPDVLTLDLFTVAESLNMKAGLKLLEGQFSIERPEQWQSKRFLSIRLWKTYTEKGIENALVSLLSYNAQDAENLYFVANNLAKIQESLKS